MFRKYFRFELVIFVFFFIFSSLLMWKTFRLGDGTIEMATKVWSDFGATIPLTRTFSYGNNIPPEYPLFSGYPIRYHFIFFFVVGILERIGIPLDWALNTLSILGFFALLVIIYLGSCSVFKSKFVGISSVTLFLFNGSFGFVEFFTKNPLSSTTLLDIIRNETFTSFGPYDGKVVSAFWSLNIFTNQRHLAIGYALVLALLFYLYKTNEKAHIPERHKNVRSLSWWISLVFPKTEKTPPLYVPFLIGFLVGLSPFIHLTGYMMMCISLLISFFLFRKIRLHTLIMGIVAGAFGLPQILLMGESARDIELLNPGYLISNELTTGSFLHYWWFNLGLLLILFPIGFLLAKKNQRKFALPFLAFFVIGNLFQFSPEMASNHKFFNLFVIGANMFAAYALYRLWKLHFLGKIIVPFLFIPMTLTGIIDIFPIFNDRYMVIDDVEKNPVASYILTQTPPDAVFLNATFLFDPANLAGRKVYLGWPYFAWSAGYDTDTRFKTMKDILASSDRVSFCNLVRQENIDYVELQNPTQLESVIINYDFFNQYTKEFFDSKTNISIYNVENICLQTGI